MSETEVESVDDCVSIEEINTGWHEYLSKVKDLKDKARLGYRAPCRSLR